MNGNITISARTLVVALLAAVALVVAYLLGSSGGSAPAAADEETPAADAAEQPRALTMTGRGEATAVPDQLSFALGVDVTRPDLDQALDAANASMSRVLAVLRKHGVEKDDVQTTGLAMDPVYDYHASGPPTLRGYQVTEHAEVLIDELKRAGAAVTAAVGAGGNDVRVDQLRLLVGDTDDVMAKARAAAVEEATAKAEQYAEASGQELGEVVTIREVHSEPLPTPVGVVDYGAALGRAAMDVPVPIRAGRDEAAVTVRIVWELA